MEDNHQAIVAAPLTASGLIGLPDAPLRNPILTNYLFETGVLRNHADLPAPHLLNSSLFTSPRPRRLHTREKLQNCKAATLFNDSHTSELGIVKSCLKSCPGLHTAGAPQAAAPRRKLRNRRTSLQCATTARDRAEPRPAIQA
jgi:hypothetical protein